VADSEAPGYSFRYEHCDVPEGMTLAQWRTSHVSCKKRFLDKNILRLIRKRKERELDGPDQSIS
jgi:hypothetical protein